MTSVLMMDYQNPSAVMALGSCVVLDIDALDDDTLVPFVLQDTSNLVG
jgi:hypothetical protein